jgi:hypothetical protein
VERVAVIDALDAMPARDVERLIAQAQRRLARCFAWGTDGAFPATISSRLNGRAGSTRASIRICARAAGTGPRYPSRGRPIGRPASPDYWRQWRAAHPAYRDRERERARARRRAGYRSQKARRKQVFVEPMLVAPHPLLSWAQEVATALVREDRRVHLSDELYPDVVSELLLARLEREDPGARATTWLRAERSWRHHLAPLLEAA